jgi:hypothetical protein
MEYDHVAIVSMFCCCLFCSSWIVTTGAKLCGSMMFNVYHRPMGLLTKNRGWTSVKAFCWIQQPYPGNHVASSKSSLISNFLKFHVSSSFQFSHVFPPETDCFVYMWRFQEFQVVSLGFRLAPWTLAMSQRVAFCGKQTTMWRAGIKVF